MRVEEESRKHTCMRNSEAVVSIIVNFPSEVIARKRRDARCRIFLGRPTPSYAHRRSVHAYTHTYVYSLPYSFSLVPCTVVAKRVINHNSANSFRSFTDCEFTRSIEAVRASAPTHLFLLVICPHKETLRVSNVRCLSELEAIDGT